MNNKWEKYGAYHWKVYATGVSSWNFLRYQVMWTSVPSPHRETVGIPLKERIGDGWRLFYSPRAAERAVKKHMRKRSERLERVAAYNAPEGGS